jgi:hypothetical protein
MFALGVFIVIVLGVVIGVRRFIADQRRRGRWDEYGPLEETQGPPRHVRGVPMDERREVFGEQEGKVIRRRQPHEPPEPR